MSLFVAWQICASNIAEMLWQTSQGAVTRTELLAALVDAPKPVVFQASELARQRTMISFGSIVSPVDQGSYHAQLQSLHGDSDIFLRAAFSGSNARQGASALVYCPIN